MRMLTAAAPLLAAGALAFAAPALAVDTIDPQAPADGACPALIAAKYPWIECTEDEHGGVKLSVADQPAPLECHMRLRDGRCAAGPEPWWDVNP